MKIYIVTHKTMNSYPIQNELYCPLLVGAAGKESFVELRDDQGDNISKKNNSYCELTGLYWIWKNSNEDVVGLCHYRRYLSKSFFSNKKNFFITKANIENILAEYDIILPKKKYFKEKFISENSTAPSKKDMEYVRKAILDLFPEYISSFDKVMNGKSAFLYNIFICRKEIINKYCSWLFPILFAVENVIPKEDYLGDKYRQRLFGFISERLFNVWLLHNELKIKEMNVVNTEEKHFHSIKINVINVIRRFTQNIRKK